ncbi:hypothetical protein B0I37DRAFT_77981 [Chaetomium sp. MPI-CAGE-AT-0009]|nr:hypothetical protein B0I37DRAFT_77981 [Chaetomium sp. MPI-CAGE-AT-0009]
MAGEGGFWCDISRGAGQGNHHNPNGSTNQFPSPSPFLSGGVASGCLGVWVSGCLKHASEARHVSTTKEKKTTNPDLGVDRALLGLGHGSHKAGSTPQNPSFPAIGQRALPIRPRIKKKHLWTQRQRNSPPSTSRRQCCEYCTSIGWRRRCGSMVSVVHPGQPKQGKKKKKKKKKEKEKEKGHNGSHGHIIGRSTCRFRCLLLSAVRCPLPAVRVRSHCGGSGTADLPYGCDLMLAGSTPLDCAAVSIRSVLGLVAEHQRAGPYKVASRPSATLPEIVLPRPARLARLALCAKASHSQQVDNGSPIKYCFMRNRRPRKIRIEHLCVATAWLLSETGSGDPDSCCFNKTTHCDVTVTAWNRRRDEWQLHHINLENPVPENIRPALQQMTWGLKGLRKTLHVASARCNLMRTNNPDHLFFPSDHGKVNRQTIEPPDAWQAFSTNGETMKDKKPKPQPVSHPPSYPQAKRFPASRHRPPAGLVCRQDLSSCAYIEKAILVLLALRFQREGRAHPGCHLI